MGVSFLACSGESRASYWFPLGWVRGCWLVCMPGWSFCSVVCLWFVGLFSSWGLEWRFSCLVGVRGSVSNLAGAIPDGWDHVWALSTSGPWAVVAGLAHGWIHSRSGTCKGLPVTERAALCVSCSKLYKVVGTGIRIRQGSAPLRCGNLYPGCLGRVLVRRRRSVLHLRRALSRAAARQYRAFSGVPL